MHRAPPPPPLTSAERSRIEAGDFQTPAPLADEVVALLRRSGEAYRAVLEPTCGAGSLLAAAARAFPGAALVGFDRSPEHLARARQALAGSGAELAVADFFQSDWSAIVAALPEPLLVLGNPPWVTSATLGALSSTNLPQKTNAKGALGLDALTGKSNFDISEWMLERLIDAAAGRRFTLAMLCKAAVARRLMERVAERGLGVEGSVHAVDALEHFSAAVSAVLFVLKSVRPGARSSPGALRFGVYRDLVATEPASFMGVIGGRSVSDVDAHARTAALEGPSELVWRSGVKHDLARVMELTEVGGTLQNGLGERVTVEGDCVYPLCKGSDLFHGRTGATGRFVLVTQRALGDDTNELRTRCPATYHYLERHQAAFAARRSRIYAGRPPFAMFGVGPYTFSAHKVAISALHKRLAFRALGPVAGRPVVLDDTSYFLACESREQAETLAAQLSSPLARGFFEARIFWDSKRPINKALLGTLSLEALARALGEG